MSSTLETSSVASKKSQLGCNDCLLHLTHHPLTDECMAYVMAYLDSEYDKPLPLMSRVDRYYTEYETRLLGVLMEGRDGCGDSEP